TTFMDAKQKSMMVCVSHDAGSGKTSGSKAFYQRYKKKKVYYIHCWQWTEKQFLMELCKSLGIDANSRAQTTHELMSTIIQFFLIRATARPLLIIDQANSLKASALRTLIALYNGTEDRLGIVILGTENLAKEIKNGVRYNKNGYDEIDSRLGRQYIQLYGATKKDVGKICRANGLADTSIINSIFSECEPKEVAVGNQFPKMVTDMRRLKRVIQGELLNRSVTV
ncbi:MAG: ATP-binding protein, partial [Bacteroidetes bacterium]